MQNKYVKFIFGICILFVSVPIILFGLVYSMYMLESIIDSLHLREMNEVGEPLTIGTIWDENTFSFVLEHVTQIEGKEQKFILAPEIPPENIGRIFDLQFSFYQKKQDAKLGEKFDLYTCGNTVEGNMTLCPFPANTISSMTSSDHHYIILTTKDTSYVDVIIRIPYGQNKYYEKQYRFYVQDIE